MDVEYDKLNNVYGVCVMTGVMATKLQNRFMDSFSYYFSRGGFAMSLLL